MAQVARITAPIGGKFKRTQYQSAVDTDPLYIGALNRRLGILNNTPSTDIQVLWTNYI